MPDRGTTASPEALRAWRRTEPARRAVKSLGRRFSGPRVLRKRFHEVCGYDLDLQSAHTYTELLYRRMIEQHSRPDPRFSRLSDKYLVRDHVRSVVGDEYVLPLLWHGRDPSALPFDDLPADYVIKTSHACDQVIRVVDGAVDRDVVVTTLAGWQKRNYYWASREAQYFGLEPRVLVEPYLRDGYADGPLDYRFHCFAGEVALIQVSDHPHAVHLFFDSAWTPLDVSAREPGAVYPVDRPARLEEMGAVASALSREFDHVRVDLFHVDGRIYVGELTFTPNAGTRPFQQRWVEEDLGRRWKQAAASLAPTPVGGRASA